MSAAAPTFDDIDADAHNLSHLLDTIVENLMNVTYPASVGDLTRVAALSIIARDMSVAMVRAFETALVRDFETPTVSETEPRKAAPTERAAA